MKIGKILKILRTSKGYTQNQMSKLLGISQNYLSLIEQEKKVPSAEAIDNFASSLSISKDALILVSSDAPKELKGKDIEDFKRLQQNILSLLLFQMSGELRKSA
jgi:transcriptional regulator with XRE-family HTH domain